MIETIQEISDEPGPDTEIEETPWSSTSDGADPLADLNQFLEETCILHCRSLKSDENRPNCNSEDYDNVKFVNEKSTTVPRDHIVANSPDIDKASRSIGFQTIGQIETKPPVTDKPILENPFGGIVDEVGKIVTRPGMTA